MVLQQYSQIVHDDDKHTGSAKRDTANGVAGIDASKEIINTVPFTVLKEPETQSFTNLLKNGDFESWSAGAAVAPDGWTLTGGAVARSATHKINTYSVELTRTGTDVYLSESIPNYTYYVGRIVTVGGWVKTATANHARVRIFDGVAHTFSPYHTGGNTWEWLTATLLISAGANRLNAYATIFNVDGTAYFDGLTLVEGLICPAFSSKPLVNDGIMLQSHTPSAANDYGKAGQWCYDTSYIYVCTATDTWKRVGIAGW